jgi:hypothetical protein
MTKVEVLVYDANKYEAENEEFTTVTYIVEKFEVKTIEAEEMNRMGYDELDDYNEYLILTLENGETATFRNTYADLFILRTNI